MSVMPPPIGRNSAQRHYAAKVTHRRTANAIAGFKSENSQSGCISMAHMLRVSPLKTPALSEYEAWFRTNLPLLHGNSEMTPQRCRRAVIVLRGGGTMKDAANAVGVCNPNSIKRWLTRLPPELGGISA